MLKQTQVIHIFSQNLDFSQAAYDRKCIAPTSHNSKSLFLQVRFYPSDRIPVLLIAVHESRW